ncbi:MAG: hypothetical protein ACLFUS_01575 [Candidatus Sumerlaeia bacterium]
MEVLLLTGNAAYEGCIKPRVEGLRLQDMVNSPSMTSPDLQGNVDFLFLYDTNITIKTTDELLNEQVERVMVSPQHVELVFEISETDVDVSTREYEKKYLGQEMVSVKILTRAKRRITGQIPRGLRVLLETESEIRPFFALTRVHIESDSPEQLTTDANYALLNSRHIESIIPK